MAKSRTVDETVADSNRGDRREEIGDVVSLFFSKKFDTDSSGGFKDNYK